MWVGGGVEVEEWTEEVRRYCESEEYCEVNVFEGVEFATHEYPVPDENRKALKWVFVYRQNETPRIVVDEVPLDVFEVLDNSVGFTEHSGLTDSGNSFVGFDDAVGEVSPGCAQYQCSESSGLHVFLIAIDFFAAGRTVTPW